MNLKACILSLFVTATAAAETLILPVQDLLYEIPNFSNAPSFNLNEALTGNFSPENPKKVDRKAKRELERKLIDFMWDQYPDAESIRIWNGNMIIRMP